MDTPPEITTASRDSARTSSHATVLALSRIPPDRHSDVSASPQRVPVRSSPGLCRVCCCLPSTIELYRFQQRGDLRHHSRRASPRDLGAPAPVGIVLVHAA